LFMPGIVGIIADRWIPAQKLLGICHFLAATFLVFAAPQTDYKTLYSLILCSVMFYMPTIALSNSVAYHVLTNGGFNIVKDFPRIRVWGTIGFIFSMILVDLLGFAQTSYQLYMSAGLGFVLSIYSFSLPTCTISINENKKSWVDYMGLRAFALFKQKKMAIFFIFSMMLGMSLQITNAFGNDYLTNFFGKNIIYKGTFGVEHANILISLSQVSETLCILLIPFFLRKFGIKKVMLISMVAWVLRFGLLGTGNPGDGVWMLVLSMIVYGVAFDFFNISGSLFVENETDSSIRSSAQGVFMIMTNGFGAFIGSYVAGWIVDKAGWPNSWFIFAAYSLLVTIVFALVFKYKHDPTLLTKKTH